MKKFLITTCVAAVATAFMSETCETVMAKMIGVHTDFVRLNKSDVDADPSAYELADAAALAAPDTAAVTLTGNEPPLPIAPGAPDGAVASGQPVVVPNPAPPAPVAPAGADDAAAKRLLEKKGKKFFIVDGSGARVTGDGIEADGYASEGDGWNAILALNAAPPPAA